MKNIFEQNDVMVEEDPAFDLMMQAALEDVEPDVPAGLAARMQAWTAVEMNVQAAELRRKTVLRHTQPPHEAGRMGHPEPGLTSLAFKDFGLLPVEERSRRSLFVSIAMNLGAAALVVFVAGAVKVRVEPPKDVAVTFTLLDKPVPPPPPPHVVPEIVPPPPVAQPRVEQPVVNLPEAPPEVKPVMSATTRVNVAPPAPLRVEPAPAPRAVMLATSAAPVANPSPRPSAVAIGHPDSPLRSAMTGPAVSPVTLSPGGASVASGSGNVASVRSLAISPGNGTGTSRVGTGVGKVASPGLASGVKHGTGTGDKGAAVVVIAPSQQHLVPSEHAEVITSALRKPPVVTYVPTPAYTDEAKRLHVEGEVKLNVRLLANGGITVLGVASGLGHGLDEAAEQAARGLRFKPATDDRGNPMDFATVITVRFQHT